jgi:hypothetical protein
MLAFIENGPLSRIVSIGIPFPLAPPLAARGAVRERERQGEGAGFLIDREDVREKAEKHGK